MSGRMKDGVIKRGSTWSYVVRVADPETGHTRPTWVGRFPTERPFSVQRTHRRRYINSHHAAGVRYCSNRCAKAQSERDRRARRRQEQQEGTRR